MYFKQLENITIETNIRGVDSRLINDKNSIIIKQLLLNPHDKIPPPSSSRRCHILCT